MVYFCKWVIKYSKQNSFYNIKYWNVSLYSNLIFFIFQHKVFIKMTFNKKIRLHGSN